MADGGLGLLRGDCRGLGYAGSRSMTPRRIDHLVFIDKDQPRVARYEVRGKQFDKSLSRCFLTHAVKVDLRGEVFPELDWEAVQAFRISPPDEFAVAQPEPRKPTEPQVA